MATEIEIRCIGVHKTFRMGEVDVPVLQGVDLEIYQGELTVILGPSGSGKSTLMNLIGGIDRPSAGEVRFAGRNLAELSDRELTDHRRRFVGFVFQFFNLVPTLTAVENVQVTTEIAVDPMPPTQALEWVGLADRQDHFPAQLSGGEQQRVALARAIAKRPRVMLCDEPTGSLDFRTGRRVLGILTDLNEKLGTTMVLITHAAPIAKLAHRVIHLTGKGLEIHENERRARAEDIAW